MESRSLVAALVLAAALIPGCAVDAPLELEQPATVRQRIEFGVIERIDLYRAGASEPTGLGAILGGVAGGVIGHQIGSGSGNTVATIAGAIGGAFAGNAIERSSDADRYRITVRLDDGARLEVTEIGEGELRVGDRVRVVNNRVYRA